MNRTAEHNGHAAGRPAVGPAVEIALTPADPARAAPPRRLAALLAAQDASARDDAWATFLGEYSRLILRTAQRVSSNYDEAMDRYAYILDQLRDNDCRRLRAFAADGRGEFTTWLVVVVRRLCIDHHRRQYGRPQALVEPSSMVAVEHVARRRLADLVAGEFDVDRVPDQSAPSPDGEVVDADSRRLLEEAVARLDVSDQLLLTLRFEDGVPIEKIARMIGAPSRFHVYRQLKRVLAMLKAALEAKGVSGP